MTTPFMHHIELKKDPVRFPVSAHNQYFFDPSNMHVITVSYAGNTPSITKLSLVTRKSETEQIQFKYLITYFDTLR